MTVSSPSDTDMRRPRIIGGGTEFSSGGVKMVEWLTKGLLDSSQLGHFFGLRKRLGGELNSPVVEWLTKG
eukprot:3997583-Pyramimonas_sp.AAC.1